MVQGLETPVLWAFWSDQVDFRPPRSLNRSTSLVDSLATVGSNGIIGLDLQEIIHEKLLNSAISTDVKNEKAKKTKLRKVC